MKNTPFKMRGFSGFGNSPLKTGGHGGTEGYVHSPEVKTSFTRGSYHEKGHTDQKPKKRRKPRKNFKYTKVGKFFSRLVGKGGMRTSSNRKPKTTKLGCGPGSCPG